MKQLLYLLVIVCVVLGISFALNQGQDDSSELSSATVTPAPPAMPAQADTAWPHRAWK